MPIGGSIYIHKHKKKRRMQMGKLFSVADILMPDINKTNMSKWSCIACDQFTSEGEYWHSVEEYVGDAHSTLGLFLPEIYLGRAESSIPEINVRMQEYIDSCLCEHRNAMIYLRRTIPDGRVREGIVGKVDLEEYDYRKGSRASVRATEETVLDRIPPRVAIRRDAVIELPHIMMLYDDPEDSLCRVLSDKTTEHTPAYGFDLMMGAGHIEGYFLNADMAEYVSDFIENKRTDGLALCVGDGNHSLASAKALYEEIKASIGEDAAREHPARYALCEIVNIHSSALDFEPIHRLIVGCNVKELLSFLESECKSPDAHTLRYVTSDGEGEIRVDRTEAGISVDPLQRLLDRYLEDHAGEIDYIHGDSSLARLASAENAIGIYCEPISKGGLFEAVRAGGSLPRKTFSMGVALEKRHYLEARKIK